MCYYIEQNTSAKKISKTFQAKFEDPGLFHPKDQISAFDFHLLPILKGENSQVFQLGFWGLIPHWAKDTEIRNNTLNARLETITEVAPFRGVTEQRCILPVTGYYEWKWLDSKGKRKEKYRIGVVEKPIFALDGLHSTWTNPKDENLVESFSLLTTEANPIMAEIHNIKKRMPLIMDSSQAKTWLESGEIQLKDNLETICLESDGQLDLFS